MLLAGILAGWAASPKLSGQQAEDAADWGISTVEMERRIWQRLNQERRQRGLNEVVLDESLSRVARDHSRKMVEANALEHDFPDYPALGKRLADASLYFSSCAENIARGDTRITRLLNEEIMRSPGHRENVLNPSFNRVGIGIQEREGVYYLTQEFASVFTPEPVESVESGIRRLVDGWRIEEGKSPLIWLDAARPDLEARARHLAADETMPRNLPPDFGPTRLSRVFFCDISDVSGLIREALAAPEICAWCFAIVFFRSELRPGGTYGLVMASWSLPAGIPNPFAEKEMSQAVLKALNGDSAPKKRVSVKMAAEAQAERAIEEYFGGKDPDFASHVAILRKGHSVTIYRTRNLDIIPDSITAAVNRGLFEVGIKVRYPIAHGKIGNYFIVAIAW